MITIEYRGRDRRGVGRGGRQQVESVAAFAEHAYQQGWKELHITVSGVEAGGIKPHPDTGKRTWWGSTHDGGKQC